MALKLSLPVLAFSSFLSTLTAFAEDSRLLDPPPINHQYQYTENEKTYTVRYERSDKTGRVVTRVFDSAGNQVDRAPLPPPTRPLISAELEEVMKGDPKVRSVDDRHTVVVALAVPEIPIETATSSSMRMEGGEITSLTQDGVSILGPPQEAVQRQTQRARHSIAQRRSIRTEKLQNVESTLTKRHTWLSSPIAKSGDNDQGQVSMILTLSSSQIMELAKTSSDLIEGIELYKERADTIQSAMNATGIDPWATNFAGRDGDGIGIYMTETGCPLAGHIDNYTRLGTPTRTNHAENVSAIIRAVSPESWVYCRGGGRLPAASDLDGVNGRPPIHIANVSWGERDQSFYRVLDRDWDNFVYNEGVATFASAGNERDNNGSNQISSPGKGFNVVTVGSFSDTNDWYSHFSSNANPAIGHVKPDVLAPGENIAAGGRQMSGTSQASPHAAGFAANLMSNWMQYAPAALKATFLASSTYEVGGYDEETVGAAGLDFHNAFYGAYFHKWSGSNSSFDYFAANDGGEWYDDTFLEVPIDLTASMSNVRIAFSYLVRGSWAYQYPGSSWANGTAYAMRIRNPSGQTVAYTDISWENPYLLLEIDPTVTGTYNIMIERVGNNDYNANFIAGLNVSW